MIGGYTFKALNVEEYVASVRHLLPHLNDSDLQFLYNKINENKYDYSCAFGGPPLLVDDSCRIIVTGDNKNRHIPQKIDLSNSFITSRVISISYGLYHTMILTEKGELFAYGGNTLGQLGLGHKQALSKFQKLNLNEFILSVNCAANHSIITSISGKCYGWGHNNGQLGLESILDRYEPTEIVIRYDL